MRESVCGKCMEEKQIHFYYIEFFFFFNKASTSVPLGRKQILLPITF